LLPLLLLLQPLHPWRPRSPSAPTAKPKPRFIFFFRLFPLSLLLVFNFPPRRVFLARGEQRGRHVCSRAEGPAEARGRAKLETFHLYQ
jgi:hypothetical protein